MVLYYHSVTPGEVSKFVQQLAELQRAAKPIRLPVQQPLEPGKNYFSITFDDGFVSVLENAVPELISRGIPVTLFVPAGYLGRVPQWDHSIHVASDEVVVTAEQLLALPEHLVAIGSHTMTHANMVMADPDTAKWELRESRRQLENALGREIKLFAFPYGKYTYAAARLGYEAGYQHVFTSEPKLTRLRAEDWLVGRISVTPHDWPLEFWLKIRGAYGWLALVHSVQDKVRQNVLQLKTALRSYWGHGVAEKTS